MLDYRIEFDSPWYLLLLALLPLVWWFSYRRLAQLGPWRRWVALALRTAVLLALISALAEIHWVRKSDRLTVLYLLDQSESIPEAQRAAMLQYVNQAIAEHRKQDDLAGVVVFAREAAIEIPPFDDNVQLGATIETDKDLLDPEFTDLAAAMRLAQASFPEDAAKRIVVVSDGNQNLEDAVSQARAVVAAGISIDVRPIRYAARAEVMVERVAVPNEIRKGEPFDLRVVLDNTAPSETGEAPVDVPGRLIITRRSGGEEPQVVTEQEVTLEPGKRYFSLRQEIDEASTYTYEARFVPDDPADDVMQDNNRATAFTYIRGSGQVLLIKEETDNKTEFASFVDALRRENLEVTEHFSTSAFSGLEELQQYDTVILANAPKEDFSPEQITALVRNTEQLGSGLIMLGGQNSFGAGGWTNTEVEKAMPVDFQIKSAEIAPRGALALVMHASEIPQGNYWQKVVSQESIKTLRADDYCGVLHWNGTEQWLWGQPVGLVRVGNNRDQMLSRVDRMVPGDMPDFDPTLIMAIRSFRQVDAAVKHCVVISDGDPTPPSVGVINNFAKDKITVSTVAVGAHGPANSSVLQDLATKTGGKYYEVKNPKALPRIFQREARRVAAPLIYEVPPPFAPVVVSDHEITRGLPEAFPPITGFVLTSLKENPLVQVAVRSPRPPTPDNQTILATWTYGLGRTVAMTTDTGTRWANSWTTWEGYDKFMSQMVRWSMRPVGDQGQFSVATDIRDGEVHVSVTALDQNEEHLNFLTPLASVVGPDMQPLDLKIEQTAPGRYTGKFPAQESGSYLVMINPGAQMAPLRSGVNVPYSAEFRTRTSDVALLETLANMEPEAGKKGLIIDAPQGADEMAALLKFNSYRHDLTAARRTLPAWHLALLLAGCLFFFDVFVRRVALGFGWARTLSAKVRHRILGRPATATSSETLERLQSRKAAVSQSLDERRAAARFEPTPEDLLGASSEAPLATPPATGPTAPSSGLAPEADKVDDDYLDRLLKAKKKARDQGPKQ